MLLQLSWFSSFAPLHPAPPTPSGNSPTIVRVHGSCVWVLWLLHFLYCSLHPHGYSVTTYLYFLIPSPLHPFPHSPLPPGNYQNITIWNVKKTYLRKKGKSKLWTLKWQKIHIYQQLKLKIKLSKQEEQRQNQVYRELFDGCQMRGGCWGWMKR